MLRSVVDQLVCVVRVRVWVCVGGRRCLYVCGLWSVVFEICVYSALMAPCWFCKMLRMHPQADAAPKGDEPEIVDAEDDSDEESDEERLWLCIPPPEQRGACLAKFVNT